MRHNFTTQRLSIKEWHSFEPHELKNTPLAEIIQKLLIPEITADFPITWRGEYTVKRAAFWIEERDDEGVTLLALDKEREIPIGFLHYFHIGKKDEHKRLRLGYLIAKEEWNKGYASELLEGFISSLKNESISMLFAAANPKNIASKRVLQKNGFTTEKKDSNGIYDLFHLELYSRVSIQKRQRSANGSHSH